MTDSITWYNWKRRKFNTHRNFKCHHVKPSEEHLLPVILMRDAFYGINDTHSKFRNSYCCSNRSCFRFIAFTRLNHRLAVGVNDLSAIDRLSVELLSSTFRLPRINASHLLLLQIGTHFSLWLRVKKSLEKRK